MVQEFSGWNGKRGIRLRTPILFGNFPVEWAVPFEFQAVIFVLMGQPVMHNVIRVVCLSE